MPTESPEREDRQETDDGRGRDQRQEADDGRGREERAELTEKSEEWHETPPDQPDPDGVAESASTMIHGRDAEEEERADS